MAVDLWTRAPFLGAGGEGLMNFELSDDQRALAIRRGSERAAPPRARHILEREESRAELEARGDRPHRTSGWPWAKAPSRISRS
jgi:hypothetical protein